MWLSVAECFALVLVVGHAVPSSTSLGDTVSLGTSTEIKASYIPRRAHSPTQAERQEDIEQYRVAPNEGFKISDEAQGTNRQPTGQEAKTAVDQSVRFHRKNKKLVEELTAGNATGGYLKIPAQNMENEEQKQRWEAQGAALARAVGREASPADINPAPSPPESSVYNAPDEEHPSFPRKEGILVTEFNGQDKIVEFPASVHPPEFDDCRSEPSYSEHVQKDTNPIMPEDDAIHPGRNESNPRVSLCRAKCNAQQACLGYVATLDNSECWLINQDKFPDGIVVMQDWKRGSTFVKNPPAPPPKNCGLPMEARVLPKSDFGSPARPVTQLTAAEERNLKAHQEEFMDTEIQGLDAYPHADQVTPEKKKEAVAERKQKAIVYYEERKEKLLEKHNVELRTKAERRKKTMIKQELTASTTAERASKADIYRKERAGKAKEAAKKQAKLSSERAFKATPEGQEQDLVLKAKKEAAHKEQDAEYAESAAQERAIREEALNAEKERLANIAGEVAKAKQIIETYQNQAKENGGNSTTIAPGSDVYNAMMFLDKEQIPYPDN